VLVSVAVFFFSSRRRHTSWPRDWSSDVCSSDLTMVKPFPISVAFDEIRRDLDASESTYTEKSALLRELGVNTLYLGVGVDRVDRSEERRVGKECRAGWAQYSSV